MVAAPLIAGANHLLRGDAAARERLAPFAGKHVRITIGSLPAVRFAVAAGGLLETVSVDTPDVTIAVAPAALPRLLRGDEGLPTVAITGDTELAAAVQFLLRHLRWDVEEDLATLVGDIAAHRLALAGHALVAWQREASERLGRNVAEYLTEEAGIIASPADLARFTLEVAELRDAAERLEKRIDRLTVAIRG